MKTAHIPLPDTLKTPLDWALFLEEVRDTRAELKQVTSAMTEGFKTLKFPKPKK
jgi:hypothetical protein